MLKRRRRGFVGTMWVAQTMWVAAFLFAERISETIVHLNLLRPVIKHIFYVADFCHARFVFTTAEHDKFTKLAVSEMLPPFARKQMVIIFKWSCLFVFGYYPKNNNVLFLQTTFIYATLLSLFCHPLFYVDKKVVSGQINMTGLCFFSISLQPCRSKLKNK